MCRLLPSPSGPRQARNLNNMDSKLGELVETSVQYFFPERYIKGQAAQIAMDKIRQGEKELHDENVLSVLAKCGKLQPKKHPEKALPAWFPSRFLQGAKHSYEDSIRLMWAKILSGEMESPGRFSQRTLIALESMSSNELRDFQKLGTLFWDGLDWVVWWENFSEKFLSLNKLHILDSIDLIYEIIGKKSYNRLTDSFEIKDGDDSFIAYFDNVYLVTHEVSKKKDQNFPMGNIRLTKIGRELLDLCELNPNYDYECHCLDKWKAEGWKLTKVSEPNPCMTHQRRKRIKQ